MQTRSLGAVTRIVQSIKVSDTGPGGGIIGGIKGPGCMPGPGGGPPIGGIGPPGGPGGGIGGGPGCGTGPAPGIGPGGIMPDPRPGPAAGIAGCGICSL